MFSVPHNITKYTILLFLAVSLLVVGHQDALAKLPTGAEVSAAVTGPTSKDPLKDILEISRAYAALYDVEACSLAKSMAAVFSVECNMRQNCIGGRTYIGSFQQGIGYVQGAEKKLGSDLAKMSALAQDGKISQGVYAHMLAAAQQGRALGQSRGRLHHMYATMLALTEHVRMERALQARTSNQLERAGAHVVFQFTPGGVGAAVNTGRDRVGSWGSANGIPRGATVFQAIKIAAGPAYKGGAGAQQVRRGLSAINCETAAGYDGPSGFGNVPRFTGGGNVLTDSLADTPLGDFLGISRSAGVPAYSDGYLDPNQNPALRPENDPSQSALTKGNTGTLTNTANATKQTDEEVRLASLDESVRGLLNTTPTATSTARTTNDSSDNNKSIHGVEPTLLCVPSTIAGSEDVLLMWACRDGAHTTEGTNIDTDSKLIGATRISPTETTTYTVECINDIPDIDNTAKSCTVDVVEPAIALISTPSTAATGETVSLSWQTKDMRSCTLTSSAHHDFVRKGIAGEATSWPIAASTEFTLECETVTGTQTSKSIVVGVE